jgi:hypothetical protein
MSWIRSLPAGAGDLTTTSLLHADHLAHGHVVIGAMLPYRLGVPGRWRT